MTSGASPKPDAGRNPRPRPAIAEQGNTLALIEVRRTGAAPYLIVMPSAASQQLRILRHLRFALTAVFVASGSVAVLADLNHNFGHAATAFPLPITFALRSARAERWAGPGRRCRDTGTCRLRLAAAMGRPLALTPAPMWSFQNCRPCSPRMAVPAASEAA